VKIIVEGSTNQSFRKLITSAPILGTTRPSLIDLSAPKLNSTHIIINAMGMKSLVSERSIGQKIFRSLEEEINSVDSDSTFRGFLELDIN